MFFMGERVRVRGRDQYVFYVSYSSIFPPYPNPLPHKKHGGEGIGACRSIIMPNIALQVEYSGTHYHGFQRQPTVITVQSCLEKAISQVANQPIKISCAGRTDAGVHATAQMINFQTTAERPLHAWIAGTNSFLPPDIAVKNAWEMPEEFHARFSAIHRSYRYIILNTPQRSGIWADRVVHYPSKLNHEKMHQAAQYLLGEQDFLAFRGSMCQANTTRRCVNYCNVQRDNDHLYIDIQANAFLLHMVRNIVGTLIPIGREQQPPEWIKEVQASGNRQYAGITMPPQGLYLCGVGYISLHINKLPRQ